MATEEKQTEAERPQLSASVWVALPEALAAMVAGLFEAPIENSFDAPPGVSVIPIHGMITRRPSWMGISQGEIRSKVAAAVADPSVSHVILHFDSPGGESGGMEETASALTAMRGKKPITAFVDGKMASGALWLGASAADEIVSSPSSRIGSIGAAAVHEDMTKMMEDQGVKTTIIRSGSRKMEGNPLESLTPEAKASIQASVDETANAFKDSLAEMRKMQKGKMGSGEMFSSQEAVARGLVDRIGTLNDVMTPKKETVPGDKMMAEDTKIKELEAENRKLRFATEKERTLSPFRTMVRAGEVTPAFLEKLEAALVLQEATWGGGELGVPSELTKELLETKRVDLGKATASDAGTKEMRRADAIFASEVRRVQIERKISYREATAIVRELKPALCTAYEKAIPSFYQEGFLPRRDPFKEAI